MSHKILILQHTDWQKPGPVLLQVARDAGVALHVVQLWRESAADFADYDALILLGGDCADVRGGAMSLFGGREAVGAGVDEPE